MTRQKQVKKVTKKSEAAQRREEYQKQEDTTDAPTEVGEQSREVSHKAAHFLTTMEREISVY